MSWLWGSRGGGGNVTSITSTYTVLSNDYTILCNATSGAITVNLPAAFPSTNRSLRVKKTDSSANALTIDGNGSETIDDGTTATLSVQYESITIVCDGSNWHIV